MEHKETSGVKLSVVAESDLSDSDRKIIERFNKECFSDVDKQEADENFIAKSFARIFAYDGERVIGTLRIFKRHTDFEGKDINLGGMGGVCVTESERGKGIATKMLQNGLEILKTEGCDIACLNVDLTKTAYKVYEKLGFRMMERQISFENSKGETTYDTGTMFIPINSKDIYNQIMNSQTTFHYGVGYW